MKRRFDLSGFLSDDDDTPSTPLMKRRFDLSGFLSDDDDIPSTPLLDSGSDDTPTSPQAKQPVKESSTDAILPIPPNPPHIPDPPHIVPPRPVVLSKISEKEMDKFIDEYRMFPGADSKERIRKFYDIAPLPSYSEVQDMESRVPIIPRDKTLTKEEEEELLGPEYYNVYRRNVPAFQKIRESYIPHEGVYPSALFAISEKVSKEIESSQNVFAKSTVIAPPLVFNAEKKTANTEIASKLFSDAMAKENMKLLSGRDAGVTRMVQYITGNKHAGLGIYEHIPSPDVEDCFWLFDSSSYFEQAGVYRFIIKTAAKIISDARKQRNGATINKDPQHKGVKCINISLTIQRGENCAVISGTMLTLIPDIPFAAFRSKSDPSKWGVDGMYYGDAIKGLLRTLHELNKDEYTPKNRAETPQEERRKEERRNFTPDHQVFYDFLRDRLLEPLVTGTPYGLGYLLPHHSRKD